MPRPAAKPGITDYAIKLAAETAARTGNMAPGSSRSIEKAIRNAPRSGKQMAEGIWHMVTHPIDTAKGARDVAAGGVRNVAYNTLPPRLFNYIDSFGSAESRKRGREQSVKADAVWQAMKKRYGSMERLQQTFEEDPVGFAADVSTLFGGGELALSRVAPNASRAAGTLSRTVDPVRLGAKAVAAVPGVSAAARSARTLLPKPKVLTRGGDFTPAAVSALRESGVNPDVFSDPALRQRWVEIARAKGVSAASAREALLRHTGSPIVTRGMTTGEAPATAAATESRNAFAQAQEGNAARLQEARPSLENVPVGDRISSAPVGQSFIDSYLAARNSVSEGYRRAYSHQGSFTPEAVNELTPTIERILQSDAFESLPDNIADFSKSHSFPETSKVLYGSGKVKPLEERFREFTVAPVTDAAPPGEVFKSAVNVGGIWFDHVDGGWKSRKTGEILKPNNPLNKSLDEVAGRNTHIVGNLPGNGIAPANVGADGRIYVGRPGDTHFDITNQYENAGPWSSDAGFVTPDGRYLDAQQAAEWTAQNPSTLPENALGIREVERIRRDITNAKINARGDDRQALRALSDAIDAWTEEQAAIPGRFTGEGANVAADMASAREAYRNLRGSFDGNPNPNVRAAVSSIDPHLDETGRRLNLRENAPSSLDQTVQDNLTRGIIDERTIQPTAARGTRPYGAQTYQELTRPPAEGAPSLLTDEGRRAMDEFIRNRLYSGGMGRDALESAISGPYGELLTPDDQMLLRQHAEANELLRAPRTARSSLDRGESLVSQIGRAATAPGVGTALGVWGGHTVGNLLGSGPLSLPGISPEYIGGALGAATGHRLSTMREAGKARRNIRSEMTGAPVEPGSISVGPLTAPVGSSAALTGSQQQEQAAVQEAEKNRPLSIDEFNAPPAAAPQEQPATEGPLMSLEEFNAPERPHRASGGRVSDIEPLVSGLMKRAQQAKAYTDNSTKPLLNAHDDAIASALAVAQRAI